MSTLNTINRLRKNISILSYVFIILTLFLGSVFVFSLRGNNLHMAKLRIALEQADKNNTDVEKALANLRYYVSQHMNTALATGPTAIKPPVQLKYSFDRTVAAEKARVGSGNNNAQVNRDAQSTCEKQFGLGQNKQRLACVAEYNAKHGQAVLVEKQIDPNFYKFDFVSPAWSPDIAGFSLIGLVIFGLGSLVFLSRDIWRFYSNID